MSAAAQRAVRRVGVATRLRGLACRCPTQETSSRVPPHACNFPVIMETQILFDDLLEPQQAVQDDSPEVRPVPAGKKHVSMRFNCVIVKFNLLPCSYRLAKSPSMDLAPTHCIWVRILHWLACMWPETHAALRV